MTSGQYSKDFHILFQKSFSNSHSVLYFSLTNEHKIVLLTTKGYYSPKFPSVSVQAYGKEGNPFPTISAVRGNVINETNSNNYGLAISE